jgi:hypothetical protein
MAMNPRGRQAQQGDGKSRDSRFHHASIGVGVEYHPSRTPVKESLA